MKGRYIEDFSSNNVQCFVVDKINITIYNHTDFVTDGEISLENSDDEIVYTISKGATYYCGSTADGKKVFLFTPQCKEIPTNLL